MSTVQFTLTHGTSKEAAQNIQAKGFRFSEMGFFGPAIYFYDYDENGIELAKQYIDLKIQNNRILDREHSVVLIAYSCCPEECFIDGTTDFFRKNLKAVSKDALKRAYNDANENGTKTDYEFKKKAKKEVNRARNAYIEKVEKAIGYKIKIFKGLVKTSEPCITIRDRDSLYCAPYEEVMYD